MPSVSRRSALASEISMYPHKFSCSESIADFQKNWELLAPGARSDAVVSVAGRIMRSDGSDEGVTYLVLESAGGKLDATAPPGVWNGSCELGDVVGLTGFVTKGQDGQLRVSVQEIRLLAPCLHELPKRETNPVTVSSLKDQESWSPGKPRNPDAYPLSDKSMRYSRRYLDMIVNPEVKRVFSACHTARDYIREYFRREFREVETAYLNINDSDASTFVTHHNQLDMDMYLRTSGKQLKLLLIGGWLGAFEIGKFFRNEKIDSSHHPEFTACVLYKAYADDEDMMEMTEDLLSRLVMKITGGYKVSYHSHGYGRPPVVIDFTPPFRRLDLEEILGCDFPADLDSEEAKSVLANLCAAKDLSCDATWTSARLLETLVAHSLGRNPTFVMHYPLSMCPSVKPRNSEAGLGKCFKLFASKIQLVSAQSDLNDPVTCKDTELAAALSYGCPPCAGWTIGIERLGQLLTDSVDLQEVVLYPTFPQESAPQTVLLVKSLAFLPFTVSVDLSWTVLAFKVWIEPWCGVRAHGFQLLKNGVRLADDRTLASYNIQSGDVLHQVRGTFSAGERSYLHGVSRIKLAISRIMDEHQITRNDRLTDLVSFLGTSLYRYFPDPSGLGVEQVEVHLLGSSSLQYAVGLVEEIVKAVMIVADSNSIVNESEPFPQTEPESDVVSYPCFEMFSDGFTLYLQSGRRVAEGTREDEVWEVMVNVADIIDCMGSSEHAV